VLFGTPPRDQLIGIARLAAESELLEAKQRVEYLEIETRQFIGRCSGSRVPFVWTINPYRGCEFGCKYCYARYAHEFMELRDPLQFERKIFAKHFEPSAFRTELRKVKPGQQLWIGTATDPYQPAERRFHITRAILEVLAGERGLDFGITTKSDLVERDVALFSEIARRNVFGIHLSITTLDEALARALEPLAPRPSLRMQAVRALTAAGVRVTVLACPVLPLINDSEASLEAVCSAAVEAGACGFHAFPVFLKPCAQRVFFPFLEEHFPHLARRYRERFEAHPYLRGDYPARLRERVHAIRDRHGLPHGESKYKPEQWDAQLELF
jgi:DNA repair photolyase